MLTPAMSARNRKKRKLARKLLRNGVDLGFSGKLLADWTGFPDEVVENLKRTGF